MVRREQNTVSLAEGPKNVLAAMREIIVDDKRRRVAASETIGLGEYFQEICDEASAASAKHKEMIGPARS